VFESRYATRDPGRFPALAAELVDPWTRPDHMGCRRRGPTRRLASTSGLCSSRP
jgi:hypothetical protein